MNDTVELASYAALVVGCWFAVFFVSAASHRPLAGLLVAYGLHQFINFVLAAILPILERGTMSVDLDTLVGFQKVVASNLAFSLGFAAGMMLLGRVTGGERQELNVQKDVGWLFKLGLFSTAVLVPVFNRIPSLGAAINNVASLMVLAVGLACYLAVARGKLAWAVALLGVSGVVFPLVSVIQGGFIGFGTNAVIIVFSIFAMRFRPRWIMIFVVVALSYFAVSVFMAYFKGRADIRASVWGGEAYAARFKVVIDTAEGFEWFAPGNQTHIDAVNGRMNQNVLVGMAVERLDDGHVEFANGQTILDAVFAMIPRIVWPDKPMKAGGGNIVSDFTGLTFAEGTSVGVGPVLEFYLNFGQPGLLLGALLFGFFVGQCDARAGAALSLGDGWRCARWFLLAMPFILPLASLAEVTMSFASMIVMIVGIERGLFRTAWYRRQMLAWSATGQHP